MRMAIQLPSKSAELRRRCIFIDENRLSHRHPEIAEHRVPAFLSSKPPIPAIAEHRIPPPGTPKPPKGDRTTGTLGRSPWNLDFHRAKISSQILNKISSNRHLFFNFKGGVLPGSLFCECLAEFALPGQPKPPKDRTPRILSTRMASQLSSKAAEG